MGKGHTPWSGHRGNRDRQELEGWRIFHTPPDRTVCHLLSGSELRVSDLLWLAGVFGVDFLMKAAGLIGVCWAPGLLGSRMGEAGAASLSTALFRLRVAIPSTENNSLGTLA